MIFYQNYNNEKKRLYLFMNSQNDKGTIQTSLEPVRKIILTFVFKSTYLHVGDLDK